MASKKIALIGRGYLGTAYSKMFPEAIVYDEPKALCESIEGFPSGLASFYDNERQTYVLKATDRKLWLQDARIAVNDADIAIIAVPTDPLTDGSLDMSIIEDVISWLETPLILISSALNPGTTNKLVAKTNKKIGVMVETIGMGKYSIPFWKYPHPTDPSLHQFLIIGGEEETARRCADIIWSKMSPSIDIHLLSAVEAEICKLWENWWGSLKVTMSNMIYDLCEANDANYTKVLQAWGADGRVEKMHCRVVPGKRGWFSHCYQKDIPALSTFSVKSNVPELAEFINLQCKINEQHLKNNG